MPDSTNTTPLQTLSDGFADAVAAAAAFTVRVDARRGHPASGIALAADLVLTADHVVDPAREKAGTITVGLPDGRSLAATVAGRDSSTDLAVLRVADAGLTPAVAAPGEARPGALALIVARPGASPMASLAVLAGVGGPARTRRGGMLERYLLVDTVMYPGFSGGALISASGQVLGLATSGISLGGPEVAIPWDVASRIGALLAEHGSVRRGYLGVGSQPVQLSPAARDLTGGQERGLLVVHVAEDGPAAKAGVLQGDILVQLAGQPVANADDLQALLGPERVGSTVALTVIRGGEARELSVEVRARE